MQFGRLAVEDFFDEVVEYIVMTCAEGLDEFGAVIRPLQGESGELQTGDPAFCA